MSSIITDSEIAKILSRPKQLPKGWRSRLMNMRRRKDDHQKRSEIEVPDDDGVIIIKCRQNTLSLSDFSVILVYVDKEGNEYRLMRCNGKHPSRHTNLWEKQQGHKDHTFDVCFHVHRATQRYQEADLEIDGFAEPTDAYSDYNGALEHLVGIYGFIDPEPPAPATPDLFGGAS
jgi:hypothetical protein